MRGIVNGGGMQPDNPMNSTLSMVTLRERLNVFLHALLFVLGFSIVFVIGFGGAATILGGLFAQYKRFLSQVGGVVLIVLGLATMDVIKIRWFYLDTRPEYRGKTGTYLGSLFMGIFFAAGWTPCVGATLGAILTLGFSQETVGLAMVLAFAYSLGLGIPFLILALALNQSIPVVRKLGKHMRTFQIISGLLIISIGLLLLFDRFALLAAWAQQSGWYLDLPTQAFSVPGFFTAVAAGLLSFLSPCVLPLVPAYLGYLSSHLIAAARQPGETSASS
jgi:cytochrome c-type biogenesis protein